MKFLIFLLTLALGLSAYATGLDYLLNGITTPVKVDTVTPANSKLYPFSYYNSLGVQTDLATATAQTTGNGYLSSILSNQTTGAQKTQISDSSGTAVTTKPLGTQVVSTDSGLVTNTVIHGLSTAGGGSYVDVKVNPSGALAVDGSGTTQPVSGTVTVQQPTGTNLHTVIDSGAVAATQSGTWNINNISGTVSLPTGASTSALQTSGNSTLTTISGQLPATLGAKTTANSLAVNIASDQTVPVSAASLPLPSGAATAANQVTANTSLATIATNSAKVPIATTGSFSCITNLTTTAQTFTAPANAVGFSIQYPSISTNTDNVRWGVGGTVTTSTGLRLEPGREDSLQVGANVSVIAETASSQTVCIQWISQ